MQLVRVDDIADGACVLDLDAHGRPTVSGFVVELDGATPDQADAVLASDRYRMPVVVGVARRPMSRAASRISRCLTCTLSLASSEAETVQVREIDSELQRISDVIEGCPTAATTLAGLLGVTAKMNVKDALLVESLAFSTLLGGSEFVRWRAQRERAASPLESEPVALRRSGDKLIVTLNAPDRRNAFSSPMRDALLEALAVAEADASLTVYLNGAGGAFSSGGDLNEFGSAPDIATAHLIRIRQSVGWSLDGLRHRTVAQLHGACIGAGIELPAFAGRVLVGADTAARLPELTMGLIPGAGGTVSITRRIGRWRTAYMALTNRPIDAETMLAWGLADGRM
jgi:Enoyl-CoA hydratase/isomerase